MAALVGAALWATAEALAQENLARPARRIVVSIPDRKLAVLEGSRVVKVFETAVGRAVHAQSQRFVHHRAAHPRPHLVREGQDCSAR